MGHIEVVTEAVLEEDGAVVVVVVTIPTVTLNMTGMKIVRGIGMRRVVETDGHPVERIGQSRLLDDTGTENAPRDATIHTVVVMIIKVVTNSREDQAGPRLTQGMRRSGSELKVL